MFAGPLGRSTFTPPKSSFDSPLYGLVSLRRSQDVEFWMKTERMEIKRKFKLKKMLFNGELSL